MLNEEPYDLADAVPVIQMEEPQIHLLAARGVVTTSSIRVHARVFNNTVKGLEPKPRLVPHCRGNRRSSACREGAVLQAIEVPNKVDATITFETKSSGAMDLKLSESRLLKRRSASA
jgi:hypothetical protein